MPRLGLSKKTARDIGHLRAVRRGRHDRVARAELPAAHAALLIHINNTNPILDEDSAERARWRARGIEVCEDGMAFDSEPHDDAST